MRFDGETYEPDRDQQRLTGQWLRVFELMQDGIPRTLAEIAEKTGDPEASISARLRDFRKPRFGGHTVKRWRDDNNQYIYRVMINERVRMGRGSNQAESNALREDPEAFSELGYKQRAGGVGSRIDGGEEVVHAYDRQTQIQKRQRTEEAGRRTIESLRSLLG